MHISSLTRYDTVLAFVTAILDAHAVRESTFKTVIMKLILPMSNRDYTIESLY